MVWKYPAKRAMSATLPFPMCRRIRRFGQKQSFHTKRQTLLFLKNLFSYKEIFVGRSWLDFHPRSILLQERLIAHAPLAGRSEAIYLHSQRVGRSKCFLPSGYMPSSGQTKSTYHTRDDAGMSRAPECTDILLLS